MLGQPLDTVFVQIGQLLPVMNTVPDFKIPFPVGGYFHSPNGVVETGVGIIPLLSGPYVILNNRLQSFPLPDTV
jgi:hypothetical protein